MDFSCVSDLRRCLCDHDNVFVQTPSAGAVAGRRDTDGTIDEPASGIFTRKRSQTHAPDQLPKQTQKTKLLKSVPPKRYLGTSACSGDRYCHDRSGKRPACETGLSCAQPHDLPERQRTNRLLQPQPHSPTQRIKNQITRQKRRACVGLSPRSGRQHISLACAPGFMLPPARGLSTLKRRTPIAVARDKWSARSRPTARRSSETAHCVAMNSE